MTPSVQNREYYYLEIIEKDIKYFEFKLNRNGASDRNEESGWTK